MYSKHPNTEPSGIRMVTFRTLFGSGYQMVRISNVQLFFRLDYSIQPKAGPSEIRMAISRTLFGSDFRMLKTGFKPVFSIRKSDRTFFPARLDRFIQKRS